MHTMAKQPLDPNSTSPTKSAWADLPRCIYANVWFAYQIEGGRYGVSQGCCNHWDCPRCGQIRARQEYARIVHGVHELSRENENLWFQTITCRGKDATKSESDQHYLEWTNRFLDAYRQRVKRKGGAWAYVQVTERQKRGHPHSHFLSTFEPSDLAVDWKAHWVRSAYGYENHWQAAYRSDWLSASVVRAGLGSEYDISRVRDEAAVSRYVAKYMFKQTAFAADWPKGWKRVRYSQSFPKLPQIKTDAFVLIKWEDWMELGRKATVVLCADDLTFDYAAWKLRETSVVIRKRTKGNKTAVNEAAFQDDTEIRVICQLVTDYESV